MLCCSYIVINRSMQIEPVLPGMFRYRQRATGLIRIQDICTDMPAHTRCENIVGCVVVTAFAPCHNSQNTVMGLENKAAQMYGCHTAD